MVTSDMCTLCSHPVKGIYAFELLQVVDLQVFAAPRITLKPLVPSFPCFANIYVSLMEKVCMMSNSLRSKFRCNSYRNCVKVCLCSMHAYCIGSISAIYEFLYFPLFLAFVVILVPSLQPHVDFGLKLLGADAMSIPGLYRIVQVA